MSAARAPRPPPHTIPGPSKYNMNYTFRSTLRLDGQSHPCTPLRSHSFASRSQPAGEIVMTSVSGHMMGIDFPAAYRGWR